MSDKEILVDDVVNEANEPDNRLHIDLPIGGIAIIVTPGQNGFYVRMAQYTPGPEYQATKEEEDITALHMVGRGMVNAVVNDVSYLYEIAQNANYKRNTSEMITKDSDLRLLTPIGSC